MIKQIVLLYPSRHSTWLDLFIIYISGLLNLNLNSDILCYGDETVILQGINYEDLYKTVNICLAPVENWYNNNNL
jgi:hypothetical protein